MEFSTTKTKIEDITKEGIFYKSLSQKIESKEPIDKIKDYSLNKEKITKEREINKYDIIRAKQRIKDFSTIGLLFHLWKEHKINKREYKESKKRIDNKEPLPNRIKVKINFLLKTNKSQLGKNSQNKLNKSLPKNEIISHSIDKEFIYKNFPKVKRINNTLKEPIERYNLKKCFIPLSINLYNPKTIKRGNNFILKENIKNIQNYAIQIKPKEFIKFFYGYNDISHLQINDNIVYPISNEMKREQRVYRIIEEIKKLFIEQRAKEPNKYLLSYFYKPFIKEIIERYNKKYALNNKPLRQKAKPKNLILIEHKKYTKRANKLYNSLSHTQRIESIKEIISNNEIFQRIESKEFIIYLKREQNIKLLSYNGSYKWIEPKIKTLSNNEYKKLIEQRAKESKKDKDKESQNKEFSIKDYYKLLEREHKRFMREYKPLTKKQRAIKNTQKFIYTLINESQKPNIPLLEYRPIKEQ
jgi:hypothetical protein